MNRIIIIGNGFDRAHGMETSYEHFINWFWKEEIKKMRTDAEEYNDSYISFHIEKPSFTKHPFTKYPLTYIIKENTISYSSLLNDITSFCERYGFSIGKIFKIENKFLESISRKASLQNWVDIEEEYYKQLKDTINKNSMFYSNVKLLNEDFEKIKTELEIYLDSFPQHIYDKNRHSSIYAKINSTIKPHDLADLSANDFIKTSIDNVNKSIRTEEFKLIVNPFERGNIETYRAEIDKINENPKYLIELMKSHNWRFLPSFTSPKNTVLLNFNYTDTEKGYKQNNTPFQSYDTIHIHGELKNSNNPMIFGYGDELSDDYKNIENYNKNEYLKYVKSINYLKTDNYKKLLSYIESEPYQIFIMGHSCGISDRTLLNTLFEHENCASIKVFFHQWKDDKGKLKDNYSDIVRNISRNFDKKKRMREIVVNKTYCEPLT